MKKVSFFTKEVEKFFRNAENAMQGLVFTLTVPCYTVVSTVPCYEMQVLLIIFWGFARKNATKQIPPE